MVSSSLTLLFFINSLMLAIALASGQGVPKFNYSEVNKWGVQKPQYAMCSRGKKQSPIDISTSEIILNSTLQPLTRNYHIYNATLATDGVEVQVLFSGEGGLIIDGKKYKLKQMHWHTPSEHRLNGVQYEAELHQVHQADDGTRAVVGILFEYGPPSRVLTMLQPQLEELAKKPCPDQEPNKIAIPSFNSSFLRRRPRHYYRYLGSLTTPPCDENVVWSVLTKAKTISKEQVAALKAPLCEANKKNVRPTQLLNGRMVQIYGGN